MGYELVEFMGGTVDTVYDLRHACQGTYTGFPKTSWQPLRFIVQLFKLVAQIFHVAFEKFACQQDRIDRSFKHMVEAIEKKGQIIGPIDPFQVLKCFDILHGGNDSRVPHIFSRQFSAVAKYL